MVHAQFLLGHPKTRFDRPAAERNSQQPTEGNTATSDDPVRQKVLYLPSPHVASHDQCLLFARQLSFGLARYSEPFDFPDFRPAFRILDPIPLPGLLLKLRRILDQVPHLAGRGFASGSGDAPWATFASLGRYPANHIRLAGPNMGIARYFRHKCLFSPFTSRTCGQAVGN